MTAVENYFWPRKTLVALRLSHFLVAGLYRNIFIKKAARCGGKGVENCKLEGSEGWRENDREERRGERMWQLTGRGAKQ